MGRVGGAMARRCGGRVGALDRTIQLSFGAVAGACGDGWQQPRRRGLSEMATPPPGYRAKLACLDLEGVLIPEVWINLAERVGLEELKRTTRDEPNYEKLMRYRLDIMKREGLTIHDINAAIESMEPFDGAPEFVAVSDASPTPCPVVPSLVLHRAAGRLGCTSHDGAAAASSSAVQQPLTCCVGLLACSGCESDTR